MTRQARHGLTARTACVADLSAAALCCGASNAALRRGRLPGSCCAQLADGRRAGNGARGALLEARASELSKSARHHSLRCSSSHGAFPRLIRARDATPLPRASGRTLHAPQLHCRCCRCLHGRTGCAGGDAPWRAAGCVHKARGSARLALTRLCCGAGSVSLVALPLASVPAPAAATQLLYSLAAAPTKVFVAGATGQTGRRVVAQLRTAGLAVRAGARDVKKAQSLGLGLAGAELVHADVTEGVDALVEAIGDADAVVRAPSAGRLAHPGALTSSHADLRHGLHAVFQLRQGQRKVG